MKIWTVLSVICLLFMMAVSVSCSKTVRGSGESASEVRRMEPFTRVYAAGNGTIVLIESDEHSVRVESEKNLLPLLSTAVINGQLTIQPLEPIASTKPIVYYISLKKLEEIHLSGTFDALSESPLRFDTLFVDISGASRLKFDQVEGHALDVALSGASSMHVKGSVNKQKIELSGAADYEASQLVSDEVDIRISGAGDASLHVNNLLKVDISGTGLVRYQGTPTISSDVSGAGSIEKL